MTRRNRVLSDTLSRLSSDNKESCLASYNSPTTTTTGGGGGGGGHEGIRRDGVMLSSLDEQPPPFLYSSPYRR